MSSTAKAEGDAKISDELYDALQRGGMEPFDLAPPALRRAIMIYATPLTLAELDTGPAPGATVFGLADLGITIDPYLAGEPAISGIASGADADHTAAVLEAMPPERAAAKRQAIRQRVEREGRRRRVRTIGLSTSAVMHINPFALDDASGQAECQGCEKIWLDALAGGET